jgi:PPP family 3-phenylpropionic acid transporter
LAEVGLLFALTRLERRFPPEMFMLLGAAAATLRWSLMAFAPLGPALWTLQALHAFTFAATHVGAMRVIQREAPEEVAGLAQTLYAALGGGLILGLATLSAGGLYDSVGAAGYGAMAAMAAVGGALILPVALAARRR